MTESDLKVLLRAWGAYWRRVENSYPHHSISDPATISSILAGSRSAPGSKPPISDPAADIWQLTQVMDSLMMDHRDIKIRRAVMTVRIKYLSAAPLKDVATVLEISLRQAAIQMSEGYVALLAALDPPNSTE